MRIDAHQHFWKLARGDYGWLTPDLGPILRDFGPEDLAPLLSDAGIERSILVQAAPTEAETRFMLDTALMTPFVAGVVGWTDFDAPDAPARIAALAAEPLLLGLRPMVHDLPDPAWLARPELDPAFDALVESGLVFDALLRPPHIAAMLRRLERTPSLTAIVDHAAKPDLVSGDLAGWREGIDALAAHPGTACKLSGLVTEAGPDWGLATLQPVFDHLLARFGPQRLIFGSDWPVVTLRASYGPWIETVDALLAPLPDAERAAIMGETAQRIYLSRRGRP